MFGNLNVSIAGKKQVITLKNNGASSANDVHITAGSNYKFKTAHAPGFNPADKAPVGGSHTMDWPSSSNVIPIPAGGSIAINVEYNSLLDGAPDIDSCWLTLDGTALTTGVSYVTVKAFSLSSNTGNVIFTNEDLVHPWVISNCQLFVDNQIDPLIGNNFNPSGTSVAIPTTFIIPPGGSQSFPYTFSNPLFFVATRYQSHSLDNPNDIFEGAISSPQTENGSVIPTLTHWGVIILGFILLAGGVVFFKRRRIA